MKSDPSLAELATSLAHLTAVTNERDRRYADLRAADGKAIDAALAAADKSVSAALSAADRAVLKAENAAERRFEAVNEFRKTLSDQATMFMPRSEAEIRLANLEKSFNASRGRSEGLKDGWGYIVGAIGLFVALYSFGQHI